MFVAKYIQNNEKLSPKNKELFLRISVTLIPIIICSIFLILLEAPILFFILYLKKIDNLKEFCHQFRQAFNKAILVPLLFVISTWILYGLFIYPREVHANMTMTSSADLNCLKNTISAEYLKEQKLILDEKSDNTKHLTKSQALVDQCFNEERIAEIFKSLIKKENVQITTLDKVANLADGIETRIKQKLQTISKYKEFQKNYSSADEYQLVYRIAYIVRNKADFQLEDIFKKEWLEKSNKTNFEKNKIEQKQFKEYFFKKIRANDKNPIEQKYEDIKGAQKSIMSGGQIVKYFAKVSRFFIVTLVFGQVYKFLDEAFELLKDSDIEFIQKILNDKVKSKISVKIIEFAISILIFFALYYIFEKFINEMTQAHAISIVQKLNSDSGYVFGINKKENQQLIMDHIPKNNEADDRELKFDDQNIESAISYRILLNLAMHPLLETNIENEFFLSS